MVRIIRGGAWRNSGAEAAWARLKMPEGHFLVFTHLLHEAAVDRGIEVYLNDGAQRPAENDQGQREDAHAPKSQAGADRRQLQKPQIQRTHRSVPRDERRSV